MTQDIKVNKLSVPTYRKLNVNDTTISNYKCDTYISPYLTGDLSIEKNNFCSNISGGLGVDFDCFISDRFKESDTIIIPCDYASNVVNTLKIAYTEELGYLSNINIVADKNSSSSIIVMLTSAEDIKAFATVKLSIKANVNSKINIYVASLLSRNMCAAIDYAIACEENATVSIDTVTLGAKKIYLGNKAELLGANSTFVTHLAYHLHEGQLLDANYVSRHIGKYSKCLMESAGTLNDQSKKTMRSTLDFVAGSKKAVGTEHEDVLLLGDNPINQSVPLILCGEEDVEGNHGATIGNLNDDTLFYLQSRGIDKDRAMKLVASTKVTSVSNLFPDENIRKEIETYEGL